MEMSQNVPECPIGENASSLNDRQRMALELIVAGQRDIDVAKAVGVDRKTIYRWRQDEQFRAELDACRRELWHGVVDRMRALLEPSVEVLNEHLHDSLDRNRYRAAVSILRISNVRGAIPVKEADQ